MLKDKNLLEKFDLVEPLKDDIAESISGGYVLKEVSIFAEAANSDPGSTSPGGIANEVLAYIGRRPRPLERSMNTGDTWNIGGCWRIPDGGSLTITLREDDFGITKRDFLGSFYVRNATGSRSRRLTSTNSGAESVFIVDYTVAERC